MQAALSDAKRSGVDYIQAHGTSTRLNDEVEARAIHRVFAQLTPQIYVSSAKGALGHWVAGAGAVGFLCALEAVRSGVLLPTAGLHTPDPACALRHIMNSAVQLPITAAMCNAFAFGGVNVSLVVEKGRA
jgi:3-oxoacyl-(acyl-carrier-protein) synthase